MKGELWDGVLEMHPVSPPMEDESNPYVPGTTSHAIKEALNRSAQKEESQIEAFVRMLNEAPQHKDYAYAIDRGGKKYIRIVQMPRIRGGLAERGAVYCFINAATLDILKPASFRKPANGARGNLATVDVSKTDPYGHWLYIRA